MARRRVDQTVAANKLTIRRAMGSPSQAIWVTLRVTTDLTPKGRETR